MEFVIPLGLRRAHELVAPATTRTDTRRGHAGSQPSSLKGTAACTSMRHANKTAASAAAAFCHRYHCEKQKVCGRGVTLPTLKVSTSPFQKRPADLCCHRNMAQRWGDTSKEAGTAQGPGLENQQSHPWDAAPDLTISPHQGDSVEVHHA